MYNLLTKILIQNYFGFQMNHKCTECGKVFTRKFNRDKHFKKQHSKKNFGHKDNYKCPFCDEKLKSKNLLELHVDQNHLDSLKYQPIRSAFDGKISLFSKKLATLQPLESFVGDRENLKDIQQVILHQLSKFKVIKAAIIVTADYRIPSVAQNTADADQGDETENDGQLLLAEERDNFSLRTKREIFNVVESPESVTKKVRNLLKSLLEREQDLLMRGSGWQFESLLSCDIEIVSHNSI